PDIVVSNNYNDVVVLLGVGDGTFRAGQGFYVNGTTAFGGGPVGFAVGDLNCDAVPDLVTTNNTSTNVPGLPTITSVLGERNNGVFLQGIPDPNLPLTPPTANPPSVPQVTAGVSFTFTVNALTINGVTPSLVDTRFTDTIHFTS